MLLETLLSIYREMEEKHRLILRSHQSTLKKDLEPNRILSDLVEILAETDEGEIKAQSTKEKRCDKLLEILPSKGPKAFEVFVEALKKHALHLALPLIESEHNARCEGLKSERDSARRENQTLKKECHELKKKSEDDQRENQPLQKEQEEKIRQLQRKDEELEGKVTNITSELKELRDEIIQLLTRQQASGPNTYFPTAYYTDESCSRCGEKERYNRGSTIREMRITKESNIQEELKEERSKTANLQREIDRLRATSKEMPGRVFNYDKDFGTRGVVYDLVTNHGKTSEVNPSSTQIVATRSSDGKGCAEDVLKNLVKWGTVSKTKDEQSSWWCVDLTEKHALYLTHYTLRHGRYRRRSVLLNWRLEGSLDERTWTTLRNHENDFGLIRHRVSYSTCTWAIDRNPSAFRYFRVLQTGKNSSGKLDISLSGIELYGVLIEKSC